MVSGWEYVSSTVKNERGDVWTCQRHLLKSGLESRTSPSTLIESSRDIKKQNLAQAKNKYSKIWFHTDLATRLRSLQSRQSSDVKSNHFLWTFLRRRVRFESSFGLYWQISKQLTKERHKKVFLWFNTDSTLFDYDLVMIT